MKLLLLAICMAFTALLSTAQPLRINEVMSSNGGVITNMDDDHLSIHQTICWDGKDDSGKAVATGVYF